MTEQFDVVVVGARCTGGPLAQQLAGHGVRVAVLERSEDFSHDPKPSQAVQSDVFTVLRDLKVLKDFETISGPFLNQMVGRFGEHRFVTPYPLRDDDSGGAAFVRRHQLDPILTEAAMAAGADVRMGTKVTGLLDDGERVNGVRYLSGGREMALRARLVVGADGRTSTVARLTGARKYNVTVSQRAYFWGYFANANPSVVPSFLVEVWDDKFHWGGQANDDLYMVGVSFDLARLQEFRRDVRNSYLAEVRGCQSAHEALECARLVGQPACVIRFEGYFREASGPGWVLAGDSGHFKDPVAGRGVGDALMQVQSLYPAVLSGLGSSDRSLDVSMSRWGRARDRMFAEHYWLAADMASTTPLPAVVAEMIRQLHDVGDFDEFLEILSHRRQVSQVMTPRRMMGATRRLMRNGDRRRALTEVALLGREEMRRRWYRWRPNLATAARKPASPGPLENSGPREGPGPQEGLVPEATNMGTATNMRSRSERAR